MCVWQGVEDNRPGDRIVCGMVAPFIACVGSGDVRPRAACASHPCSYMPSVRERVWGKADCLQRRLSKQRPVAKGTAWEEARNEVIPPSQQV